MRFAAEYALFRLLEFVVTMCPLPLVRRFGAGLGAVAYRLMGSRRAVASDNLRHAFPERTAADLEPIARASFRNYGIAMFEFLWFPRMNDERLGRVIRMTNPELLHRAHAAGKGVVVLSGHFGNWELIAFGVARLTRHPFSIIVQTQSNPLVDRAVNRLRTGGGNTVIPMGISVRETIRTLREGGVVAIAPDQSGPMEGPFVDFFGRDAATHQGPAALALKCGSPLLIGFLIREEDGNYAMTLEEIPKEGLSGSEEEQIVELTQRHTSALERQIRKHPDHWLWMHRRWKHLRPEGHTVAAGGER